MRYNEYKAAIGILDLVVLKGKLPPKVFGLVMEWASQHQEALMEDWNLAKRYEILKSIAPLE